MFKLDFYTTKGRDIFHWAATPLIPYKVGNICYMTYRYSVLYFLNLSLIGIVVFAVCQIRTQDINDIPVRCNNKHGFNARPPLVHAVWYPLMRIFQYIYSIYIHCIYICSVDEQYCSIVITRSMKFSGKNCVVVFKYSTFYVKHCF